MVSVNLKQRGKSLVFNAVGDLGELTLKENDVRLEAITLSHLDG